MAGGSRSKKRRRSRKRNPAEQLTDDLLVEILARVPYRSLCRFRCVSTRWRALISHPDNRARLPQSLAGFFHIEPRPSGSPARYSFTGVAEAGGPPLIHPSLSFLPDHERELLGSCNGLLLCRCYRFPDKDEFDYLVVNPVTEESVAVPVSRPRPPLVQMALLGFDPTFSSHFHVFEFQMEAYDHDGFRYVPVVKIYSSATGVWSRKQTDWSIGIMPWEGSSGAFVNCVMYFLAVHSIIGAVDVEGKTWRRIDFPYSEGSSFSPSFSGLSQGQLHAAFGDGQKLNGKLEIWVLEDKDSEDWTLKHTISFKHLVGKKRVNLGLDFSVVAFHPDRNMVFFVFGHRKKTLMSYDMDSRRVYTIHNLGREKFLPYVPCSGYEKFLPYVPLFSKSLPDGANGNQ
ncbi:unnamed protein product [Urochloa decumbens]|uniref:F-box domain-containing protein n=1 Tax=Urochloa decumbens TaxID=240449 RepID=A0ABC9GEH7_9POAL